MFKRLILKNREKEFFFKFEVILLILISNFSFSQKNENISLINTNSRGAKTITYLTQSYKYKANNLIEINLRYDSINYIELNKWEKKNYNETLYLFFDYYIDSSMISKNVYRQFGKRTYLIDKKEYDFFLFITPEGFYKNIILYSKEFGFIAKINLHNLNTYRINCFFNCEKNERWQLINKAIEEDTTIFPIPSEYKFSNKHKFVLFNSYNWIEKKFHINAQIKKIEKKITDFTDLYESSFFEYIIFNKTDYFNKKNGIKVNLWLKYYIKENLLDGALFTDNQMFTFQYNIKTYRYNYINNSNNSFSNKDYLKQLTTYNFQLAEIEPNNKNQNLSDKPISSYIINVKFTIKNDSIKIINEKRFVEYKN